MSTTPWTGRAEELNRMWTEPGVPEYRVDMIHIITRYLFRHPEATVLDAGCGTGLLYSLLPSCMRDRYTGLDFDHDMLEYACQHYPEGRFIHGNILKYSDLPVADLIITQNVLQHIIPWQFAAENLICQAKKAILLCERSNKVRTVAKTYSPVISWSFKEDDMLKTIRYIGKGVWGDIQGPKVLSRPRCTQGRRGVLTIYGMRRA